MGSTSFDVMSSRLLTGLVMDDVSAGTEAATDDESSDGAGSDSIKWLPPKRFNDSTSIECFASSVAFPFGFLIKRNVRLLFQSEHEIAHVPGLNEIGQIMN